MEHGHRNKGFSFENGYRLFNYLVEFPTRNGGFSRVMLVWQRVMGSDQPMVDDD